MSTRALSEIALQSRYAAQLLQARPALAEELDHSGDRPFSREHMLGALAALEGADEEAAKRLLRELRQRVFLRVLARDLAGLAPLEEVCGTMSDLAETCIIAALRWAEVGLVASFGVPRDREGRAQRLMVVGMGKLGGRELNVSSDIDLVFVYPEEGETDGEGVDPDNRRTLSNHEFFVRLGRKLISLLNERTGDGYVFRVDMRLRPDGDSGPLAIALDPLESYFVAHGREWERYAWIKARLMPDERPGDPPGSAAGAEKMLEAVRRPFVFRKYLDYATITGMRRLHAEVRREVARRELAEHIKLGPGGIREIEFVAQALQLVRGGRDHALTVRPTLQVLERLSERRLLPAGAAAELSEAYTFLRRLEHRLQYLDDAQTHTLPGEPGDRTLVAALMGFPDWDSASARLDALRATVSRHFGAVFAESQEPANGLEAVWQEDAGAIAQVLQAHGFRDASATAARVAAVRASQRYAALPTDSRQRVDALVPRLAAAAQASPAPDETLTRGLDLIEAIARRAAYLALLAEHRQALERVARMIGASSWAADFVTRHPLLLDELLDDRVLYAEPDWPAFSRELAEQLAVFGDDTERQMNVLREAHQSQVFRLLAQDLAGLLTVERLADHLSLLADLTLSRTLELCWSQLRNRHSEDAPRFAVIAYGKLGGKELGYASDLDIIFIYDDDRPGAAETYARLAQRLNNWLTSRTSSGQLFDTDLRLRPSGASGLLVSSVEAFTQYQEQEAWVWEHQALTRARHCAGDAATGAAFEQVRERILRRPRDPQRLAAEVLGMREKMHAAHPNDSGLFDVKHERGAMIDIEFIVQYLVLAHAHDHPRLTANLGNIALLGMAGELGLIDPALALRVQEAYREFRRLQHALRLNGAQYARVPPEGVRTHAHATRELWTRVFGDTAPAPQAGRL